MRVIDIRDALSGALLLAIGASVALYSAAHYQLGTLFQMGPGMLPTVLGALLAFLGLVIFVSALFRAGGPPVIQYKELLLILLAMIVFAVLVEPFGLVPATLAMTLIATRADSRLSLGGALLLGLALCALAVAVFVFGLRTPLSIIRWPF